LQQERLEGATLLVLANKSDLEGSLGPEAVAAALELHRNPNQTAKGETSNNIDIDIDSNNNSNCNNNNDNGNRIGNDDKHHKPDHSSRHWTIQASSAVTGTGLAESIDWLVRDITDRIYFAA